MHSFRLPRCLATATPHVDLHRPFKRGFLTTLLAPALMAALLPATCLAEANSLAKPDAPAGGAAAATPGTPAAGKVIVFGGASLRLGMTKGEVMAQIERNPDAGWFVQELDSPPTGELYKMDKWGLSCKHTAGATSGGGTVSLSFENEKLVKIDEGK